MLITFDQNGQKKQILTNLMMTGLYFPLYDCLYLQICSIKNNASFILLVDNAEYLLFHFITFNDLFGGTNYRRLHVNFIGPNVVAVLTANKSRNNHVVLFLRFNKFCALFTKLKIWQRLSHGIA